MRHLAIPARVLTVLGVFAALLASGPAIADQTCRNLEASLASVSNGGDRAKLRRYERAVISQKQQLERAKIRQSNSGCSSFLSSLKPHCGEVRSTVDRMERNLLELQRTKNELAGGNASQEKVRILAAIDRNGCRDGGGGAGDEDRPTGLFARLFGGHEDGRPVPTISEQPREAAAGNRIAVPHRSAPPGNYRTLCVRTCDGYFFPIAYASSPQLFDRDMKACESMCPGTEVELYYHSVPDEETDAMVSAASGEPYMSLPAAFKYRDANYERPKACQCNPPKDFSIIAGHLPEQAEEDEQPTETAVMFPAPEARPDPAEDPETRANREGGLTPSAIAELLAPKIVAKENAGSDVVAAATETEPQKAETREAGDRRVRVVGPAFLPDPEAAIDLRAPGRTELR
jgi:hypothetical protein